ncbi:MAG: hypothetical protein CMB56_001015 [Methanobacteriota archaeon]|nr:MAG: hypothetical protein CMB56_001015 [Euryarchaeota archaeon]|tara:strand:- start:8906 stop:9211 length:306 start_codon:yes stop_codon:yes gene_type:complete
MKFMEIDVEKIHASIGPVQEILDEHDGIVNVLDTTDGNIMISLEGGCTGCSSTPMTAMQIYYSLMKLENVNDVIFVNGELPPFMRNFINQKLEAENELYEE